MSETSDGKVVDVQAKTRALVRAAKVLGYESTGQVMVSKAGERIIIEDGLMTRTVKDWDALAAAAYDAYCDLRDWKSVRGEALPRWEGVEPGIKTGWIAAAKAVVATAIG